MVKILIGGSPCTKWSIAQKNNRETIAEGEGWELFRNFLIAKEKFKPDFFLYENNKSIAQPIKDQISKELGVPLQYINSALVSAQNRQRFYAHNIPGVPQPENRGILLKDILETTTNEIGYELSDAYYKGGFDGNLIGQIENNGTYKNGASEQPSQQYRVYSSEEKSICLNGGNQSTQGIYAVPFGENEKSEAYCLYANYWKGSSSEHTLNKKVRRQVAEPIRIGSIKSESQAHRVYSSVGKSVSLSANGGGQGGKTGLYATPTYDKSKQQIYEVKNGFTTIKDKNYPIKLKDGYYIIRKLTVKECCRLQTLPDDYCRAVSNSQAYKGLGNGWTAEVIIHILKHMNIPLDEEIVVLSLYDGIGTGRYCFDKLGYTNIKYYAYEIDKYAMQVANSNYKDIIQCGDAFRVRFILF